MPPSQTTTIDGTLSPAQVWARVAEATAHWAAQAELPLRDVVVLVPFVQLLDPARRAFASRGGWQPRVETTATLASALAPLSSPAPSEPPEEELVSTEELEDVGPIDIVIIGFPPGAPMTGEAAGMVMDLVDRGVIRVLDALFVMKNEDGTFSGFDAKGLSPEAIGEFAVFEGATSGLIGDEDVAEAAEAMEPGSAAVMIVYENRWAAPFAATVRRNGGRLLYYERVPTQDIIAALDRLEAAS